MDRWRLRARWIGASLRSRIQAATALEAYGRLDDRVGSMLRLARHTRADVWIANDWNTLPVAVRLAREFDCDPHRKNGPMILYDSHELATEEYAQNARWRLFHRPFRRALERSALGQVDAVTAVSPGIALRLADLYGLTEAPLVVRNTPAFQACPFNPTGSLVRVLYHGIVAPGRGLEEAIASLRSWRPEFSLSIRGPGDIAYLEHLKRMVSDHGQAGRVHFLEPVAMLDLVSAASGFDIGLLSLPGHSAHNALALPNKIFEYVMAGLAVCVSDLPEMVRLVDSYRFGRTIAGSNPAAIAAAINGFDRLSIDRMKTAALAAARELCWEEEQKVLLACIEKLAGSRQSELMVRG